MNQSQKHRIVICKKEFNPQIAEWSVLKKIENKIKIK